MLGGARQARCRESWRSLAFGAGTAAGSFGQFLFSPLAVALIDALRLAEHAGDLRAPCMLLILPLSLALSTPREPPAAAGARRRNR